ncbi:RNA polymerase sigma factor [Rossellomorea vietnamensis]|uniref:RNA polymerase sigma factor n=1 Tax=Rossellomorea vietnamensis TaxID=218284 RepID=A0A5D4NX84_9BACI|nr:RNA polymerase sigma factor [Rossellomorea vietnamensis]TYS18540.1 RNA polymerase sigma factor [Rossellomorea vietnamensis]
MAGHQPLKVIEDVYNKHYSYLRNFLMGLTRDGELADEIIQELFAKILLNPSTVFEVRHMKSWLVRGAKNTLLDHYKKKKPYIMKDETIIESLLIENETPEFKVILKNELGEIMNSLSSTDRAIILAKEFYGYNYQEISGLMEIPVATLKSKVFRIKKQIAREGD